MSFKYPLAQKSNIVDNYHGTQVQDPYRWLEDPNSKFTKLFIQEQNILSRTYMYRYRDHANVKKCFKQLYEKERYSCPCRHGDYYTYNHTTGVQDYGVLYKQNTLDSESSVLLDPNTLSADASVGIGHVSFSTDGNTIAYAKTVNGSGWWTVIFRDVKACVDYPESLHHVKCSQLSWTHDNLGIFYSCFPEFFGGGREPKVETVKNTRLFYHILSTPQDSDILVVDTSEVSDTIVDATVSDCGRWLVMTLQHRLSIKVAICKLPVIPISDLGETLPLTVLISEVDVIYRYITSINDQSYGLFQTNKDAPNSCIVKVNLDGNDFGSWTIHVPENTRQVLDWARAINLNKLVICYIRNVTHVLQIHDLNNGILLQRLSTEPGSIVQFTGSNQFSEIFFKVNSFLNPGIIYSCDLNEDSIHPKLFRDERQTEIKSCRYKTEQIFYKSFDSTEIPMFITSRSTLKKNSSHPCLLEGFGGLGISNMPKFKETAWVFIKHFKGILAVANVRGGGEFGTSWHNSGRFLSKQASFDDFLAAAEYLIAKGYTSERRLAFRGESNGGLLVAACINQRPSLCRVAVIQAGLLDMLRYHLFTVGERWATEYGTSADREQFRNLLRYSPLHNIKEPEGEQFPATLVLTGDHDDLVVPSHSYKYVASLQNCFRLSRKQVNPVLLMVDSKTGQGAIKPLSKVIDTSTDILTFLALSLELNFHP